MSALDFRSEPGKKLRQGMLSIPTGSDSPTGPRLGYRYAALRFVDRLEPYAWPRFSTESIHAASPSRMVLRGCSRRALLCWSLLRSCGHHQQQRSSCDDALNSP